MPISLLALILLQLHVPDDKPAREVDEYTIIENLDGLAGPGEMTFKVLEKAGAFSKEALPFYLKLLTQDPPLRGYHRGAILLRVSDIKADRSKFRPVAVKSLDDEDQFVALKAIALLEKIGTEDDAVAVAAQLSRKKIVYSYYYSVVKTLAVIGTEKEIKALDEFRETGMLKGIEEFGKKVDECKKAIQKRAEEKKLKAKSPDK